MPSWRPLVDGELGGRARAAIAEIASDLDRLPAEPGAVDPAERALFFAYAHRAAPAAGHGAAAAGWLDRAVDELAAAPLPPALHGGFVGVAWIAEHLEPGDGEDPDDDANAGIDATLRAALARGPWTGDHDLIGGLAGLIVYGLERGPRAGAHALLFRLLEALEQSAEPAGPGIAWRTPAARLPPWERALAPDGYHNLGVAHGVPGVIAALARLVAAGVEAARAGRLLDGAVAWLLAQRQRGGDAAFAQWVTGGDPAPPARSAWCYGDPGVAVALLGAARRAGVPAWAEAAHALARGAARRDPARAGVRDAGVCHGAAGLAHLFNRLSQATGDRELAEAARRWLEAALAFRKPGAGLGGFLAHRPGPTGEVGWRVDPGLLTGAAGIGLALLAATTAVEPGWDRLLAADVP
jgi:lantibiotic biosynthesis protein